MLDNDDINDYQCFRQEKSIPVQSAKVVRIKGNSHISQLKFTLN
jgi:hypothetical protein